PVPASENEVLERDLELRVVSINFPVDILRRCRLEEFRRWRITGKPQLHRTVVDSVSAALDLRAGISRVPPGADILELEHAAGLVVAVQNVFGVRSAHLVLPVWLRVRLRA